MIKTLKLKIIISFMFLIVMLAVAGTISIVQFDWLSNSINGMIGDNYKSIKETQTMLQALEREDSGILLLMLGEWKEGRDILISADSMFLSAFQIAKNNVTEPDEEKYLSKIKTAYNAYKYNWERPIVDTDKEGNITWYKNNIHQLFLNTKIAVNELMALNQLNMYVEASQLNEKSKRAIMPNIVSIIAALVFLIILNFFITRYIVNPISQLMKAVNNYKKGDRKLQVNIRSNDEIKRLEQAISDLLSNR